LDRTAVMFQEVVHSISWSGSDGLWMSGSGEKLVVDFECFAVEADECHGLDAAGINVTAYCFDGDAGCAVRRKGVDAGADGGEGYGADIVLLGEFKAVAITACEKIVFAAIASVPDRADGVENPFGGKLEAGSGFCVSGGAAVEFAAGSEEFGAGGAVDSAIDPAAPKE
jgi:hypothetical protein